MNLRVSPDTSGYNVGVGGAKQNKTSQAPIAQGLEHNAYNVGVDGSKPSGRTI